MSIPPLRIRILGETLHAPLKDVWRQASSQTKFLGLSPTVCILILQYGQGPIKVVGRRGVARNRDMCSLKGAYKVTSYLSTSYPPNRKVI